MWYQLELWKGWEAKVSTWVVTCVYMTTFPTGALTPRLRKACWLATLCVYGCWEPLALPRTPQGEGGWQPRV